MNEGEKNKKAVPTDCCKINNFAFDAKMTRKTRKAGKKNGRTI